MFARLRWLLAGTLRRQLIVGMVLVVASTMSLFVWDSIRRQQAVVMGQQSGQALALANSLATASAVWVASRDLSGVQEIVDGLARYPDLRYVIVLDSRGQILAHSDLSRRGLYLTDLPQKAEPRVLQQSVSVVDVVAPIMLADNQLGWARIGMGRDSLDATLASIARNGMFYTLIAIALSAFLAWLTGRYMTRRLYAIERVADAVQSGNSTLRAEVHGQDEAARLARQFNHMLDALTERETALSLSEARFRSLTEMSSDFYWESDAEHRLTQRISSGETLSPESVLRSGKRIGQRRWEMPYLSPDEVGWQAQRAMLDAHLPFRDFELSRLAADNTESHVTISGDPVFDAAGNFKGYRGVGTEITERKHAEKALLESERRFRELLENIELIGVLLDGQGNVTFANDYVLRVTGWKREEVLGRNWFDIFVPPDAGAKEIFTESIRLGAIPTHYENEILTRSGVRRLVVWNNTMLRDESGVVAGSASLGEDITERKQAETALKAREERFQMLFDGASDGIMIVSPSGSIVAANEAYARMHGYSIDEILAINLNDLDTPKTRHLIGERMQRVLSGESITFETEHYHKDGHTFPLEVSANLIASGSEPEIQSFHRDITERKQAEAAREQLEQQLRESQKMEAIGTLAGGIAHDFNNALATILGNVELACQDASTNPIALESLEEIRKAGSRTRDLVQQILSFSRKQPMERKPTALTPIVEASVRLLRATLPARLTLEVQCDADVPPVLAAATQIQQVLINLATNAMQAMPSGPGRIGIRLDTVMLDEALTNAHPALGAMYARRPGGVVRLAVSDDGSGMDAATIARIFEPFFTTKPAGEGTGLGLSVVHGIVQAHEGAIAVDSAPGRGSTFTLYLPTERRFELRTPEPEKSAATVAPDIGGGQHILYIDDDESLVFLVKRMLERRGYHVSGYTNQREALAALRADPHRFDLVVTDYNMPGMSGLDVAREVRAIRADLPVAVASGFIDVELRAQAGGAGVRELIFKADAAEDLCEAFVRLTQTVGEESKSS